MSKALEQLQSGLLIGHFALGMHGDVVGSVRQQAHDGDTLNVRALGNFGLRFLGIDAPEISFTLPNKRRFTPIADPLWKEFLADPLNSQKYGALNLSSGLVAHLQAALCSDDVAANHHRHAKAAEQALEREIFKDLAELNQSPEQFEFFTAFAAEVIDRYGRLLAYVNRYQESSPRPVDYNGRLLQQGMVNPYFIWPNINPFRKQLSLRDSVPQPGTAHTIARRESTLRQAREWVQAARANHSGVFSQDDPLRLQAFELRFLAQRRAPNRWVIDLSRNDDVLIPPEEYYTVPNVEDRLFIPEEHVSLFEAVGWKTLTTSHHDGGMPDRQHERGM